MRSMLVLALVGCHVDEVPIEAPATPVPARTAPSVRVTLPDLRVEVDSFTEVELQQVSWHPGGMAAQAIGTIEDNLRWLLRGNHDETLAAWVEEHHDWKLAKIAVTACGKTRDAWLAVHEPESITCVMTATGDHPAYIPQRRAIGFEIRDHEPPIVGGYEIESDSPLAWQGLADRWLASIRCD